MLGRSVLSCKGSKGKRLKIKINDINSERRETRREIGEYKNRPKSIARIILILKVL